MTVFGRSVRVCVVGVVFLGHVFCHGVVSSGAVVESAKWLPEETLLFVSVESVGALQEKFKETSLYGLYKEPAMQSFMVAAERNIREKAAAMMKEAWQEIGLEDPLDELPWPEGNVVFAMFVQPKTIMVPDYSSITPEQYEEEDFDFDPDKLPKKQQVAPDFQMVFLAEMGGKAQAAETLAGKVAAKAVEDGAVRQRETVLGVEINVIKTEQQGDEDFDTLCYGFRDDWLIGGSSLKYVKKVLMLSGGAELRSLGDNRDFSSMCSSLGDSDVFFFLSASAIIDLIKSTAPAEEKEKVGQVVRSLGLDNVTGLAATMQMAPSKTEEMRIKTLLGVRGAKKGIVALLTPATVSTRINRLLKKDLAGWMVANYDLAKVYDGIVQIVWDIGQVNMDGMIQTAMVMTGRPGENGQPPVNLRQEVIGQLRSPIVVTTHVERPYTDPDCSKMLLAIGVGDDKTLDIALARMHETFIAQGKKDMRRELLNCTIYMLPALSGLPFMNPFGMQPMMSQPDEGASEYAFAVASDQLVFGPVKLVEQNIRDLRREDIESISSDPMYQYASHYLPSQAGMISYQNDQINGEVMWTMWSEAARRRRQQETSPTPGHDEADWPGSDMAGSPMDMLLEALDDTVDFGDLPDFELVKKYYYGATVSYVIGNEQGIYSEMISLKAPPDVR